MTHETTTCLPPDPSVTGWHWLEHASGSRIVSEWVPMAFAAPGMWDASALGRLGVSPEQRAAWGWRWRARCLPPEEMP